MEQEMEGMQKHWAARMSQLDAELRLELRSAYDVRVLLDELAEKTRSLASRQELGPRLCGCNAVCPGWVKTDVAGETAGWTRAGGGRRPDRKRKLGVFAAAPSLRAQTR